MNPSARTVTPLRTPLRHWRCPLCAGLASTTPGVERCECGPCGAVMEPFDLDALEDALMRLVQGRSIPQGRDRTDEFWPQAGQWTVWLDRAQHDRYRAALQQLDQADAR